MSSQNYIYLQTEKSLWTVGFFKPNGCFQPEKDFGIDEGGADAAARRVHWLNGGCDYDTDAKQTEKDATAEIEQCREWAGKFGGKTLSSVESIIRSMDVAQFIETEKAMYFAGVKRLLVLMFDDLMELDDAINEFIDGRPDFDGVFDERAAFEHLLKEFAMFLVGRENK